MPFPGSFVRLGATTGEKIRLAPSKHLADHVRIERVVIEISDSDYFAGSAKANRLSSYGNRTAFSGPGWLPLDRL
jgi:hypothetical protein